MRVFARSSYSKNKVVTGRSCSDLWGEVVAKAYAYAHAHMRVCLYLQEAMYMFG